MSEVVRIQPLGGGWETLGADRLRGIVAEGVSASANDWGPDALNFTLKAESGAQRPDLAPFTPLEYEVDGDLVWAGFVWQRPADSNGYQVGCRGWQYHLDDNLFDRVYVETRLANWQDVRTFATVNLDINRAICQVNSGDSAIVMGWPKGSEVVTLTACGVSLDLGPDSTAKRLVIDVDFINSGSDYTLVGRTNDTRDYSTGSASDFFSLSGSSANGVYSGTASAPYRYVALFWQRTGVSFSPIGADEMVRIKSVKVFRDTAYESGNASILKADTVVRDALTFAPLLNQSVARIGAGTFNIPEYSTGGYVTPRQAMEAVNALENYRLKIGGDDLRTLVYDLKPSTPTTEAGEWSGSKFTDATVTGEEIYNVAVVDASGPDSARLVSKQGSAPLGGRQLAHQTATNNNPWTAPVQMGLFARTIPALSPGVPYGLNLDNWSQTGGNSSTVIRSRLGGNATDNPGLEPDDYVEWNFTATDGLANQPSRTWLPKRAYTQLVRQDYLTNGSITTYVLGHSLLTGNTLPDRRLFPRAKRVDVSAAVTQAVADRIADLYLTEHLTAPFAGTLTITGAGARGVATGLPLRPHKYLLQAGEKIRLANQVNPDTGDWGRDGRIAGVRYDHDNQSVEIAIDDQRQKFETVLSRYASLVGG